MGARCKEPGACCALTWVSAKDGDFLHALPEEISEDGLLFTHTSPREKKLKIKDEIEAWNCFEESDWRRIFVGDVHVPMIFGQRCEPCEHDVWTVNLIELLCAMEDERQRLRFSLQQIKDSPVEARARALAEDALSQCYHNWLVKRGVPDGDTGSLWCAICGKTR
jgi:hypothetical protein